LRHRWSETTRLLQHFPNLVVIALGERRLRANDQALDAPTTHAYFETLPLTTVDVRRGPWGLRRSVTGFHGRGACKIWTAEKFKLAGAH
jgi:hypothetical protein